MYIKEHTLKPNQKLVSIKYNNLQELLERVEFIKDIVKLSLAEAEASIDSESIEERDDAAFLNFILNYK